jgi:hypothetical protein
MGLEVAEVDGDKAARIINGVYGLLAAVVRLADEAMHMHAGASPIGYKGLPPTEPGGPQ